MDLIITDLAVFKVNKGKGLELIEIAPNVKEQDVIAKTACQFTIAENLKEMQQVPIDN